MIILSCIIIGYNITYFEIGLYRDFYFSHDRIDVSFSLSGHLHKNNPISAPIQIDNVACYGAEAKLIDCSYHTDTSEDDHSEDIWVRCVKIDHPDSSTTSSTDNFLNEVTTTTLSAVAVTMTLVLCVVVVIVVVTYVVFRHIRKKKRSSNER